MRFQVPQFIGVEDKIFGRLIIKQFVYVAGSLARAYFSYRFVPKILAFVFILPIIGLGLALAFYKINNKPFIFILEAASKYIIGTKLYIWKREQKKPTQKPSEDTRAEASLFVPKLSQSKLKDLTWSLDIRENLSPGVSETMRRKT